MADPRRAVARLVRLVGELRLYAKSDRWVSRMLRFWDESLSLAIRELLHFHLARNDISRASLFHTSWPFIEKISPSLGIIRSLGRVKKEMRLTRYFTYMLVSVWKIVGFVISSLLILYMKGDNVGYIFTKFPSAFGDHKLTVMMNSSVLGTAPDLTEILIAGGDTREIIPADLKTPVYVLLLQVFCAYFAYIFGERVMIVFSLCIQRA